MRKRTVVNMVLIACLLVGRAVCCCVFEASLDQASNAGNVGADREERTCCSTALGGSGDASRTREGGRNGVGDDGWQEDGEEPCSNGCGCCVGNGAGYVDTSAVVRAPEPSSIHAGLSGMKSRCPFGVDANLIGSTWGDSPSGCRYISVRGRSGSGIAFAGPGWRGVVRARCSMLI